MSDTDTIFISIASYRDPECQHTVRDLFAKADHPERLRFGICGQYDPDEDKDCFEFPPQYPEYVREKGYNAADSKGGCWARAEALSLRENETYVMQIDAHMRARPHWDTMLIDTLARCPGNKNALTAYLFGYAPPDELRYFSEGL